MFTALTLKERKYLMHSILINAHLCGIIGLMSPYKDLFLLATPVNLILSTVIVYYHHSEYNKPFITFSLLIFLSGYFLEVAGVKTGKIFGEYHYGSTLGFKILDVPPVMGLNWLVLIYSAGVVFNKLKTHYIIKSLLGAAILTGLDLFIEPIAIKYDFWIWASPQVPIQNYITWFLASFVFLSIFYNLKFNKTNKMALSLYLVQLGFFVILNLI